MFPPTLKELVGFFLDSPRCLDQPATGLQLMHPSQFKAKLLGTFRTPVRVEGDYWRTQCPMASSCILQVLLLFWVLPCQAKPSWSSRSPKNYPELNSTVRVCKTFLRQIAHFAFISFVITRSRKERLYNTAYALRACGKDFTTCSQYISSVEK